MTRIYQEQKWNTCSQNKSGIREWFEMTAFIHCLSLIHILLVCNSCVFLMFSHTHSLTSFIFILWKYEICFDNLNVSFQSSVNCLRLSFNSFVHSVLCSLNLLLISIKIISNYCALASSNASTLVCFIEFCSQLFF